ncbi:MAG: putative aspartyl protease, partial [Flavobacteriales bacterium]
MDISKENTLRKLILLLSLLFLFPSNPLRANSYPDNRPEVKTVLEKRDPDLILIPFDLVGNMIVVKARVNGQEGNFIVDTGTDIMVLNSSVFAEHQYSFATNGVSINDRIDEVKMTNVKFAWNGIQRRQLAAKIIDLKLIERSKGVQIIGFIGHSILKDFEVLFDYEKRMLTLFRLDRRGERIDQSYFKEPPVHRMKLSMADHFPYVKAEREGRVFQFIIDSGAEMNLLSPRAEKALSADLNFINTRYLIGFGQERIPTKEYLVQNLKINDLQLKPMHTLISKLDGFNEVLNHSLDGFLGYEFLSQQKTSINFRRKELLL